MREKLIDVVGREGVDHLEAYFAPGAYTGQWFETFAGGGFYFQTGWDFDGEFENTGAGDVHREIGGDYEPVITVCGIGFRDNHGKLLDVIIRTPPELRDWLETAAKIAPRDWLSTVTKADARPIEFDLDIPAELRKENGGNNEKHD